MANKEYKLKYIMDNPPKAPFDKNIEYWLEDGWEIKQIVARVDATYCWEYVVLFERDVNDKQKELNERIKMATWWPDCIGGEVLTNMDENTTKEEEGS